MKLFPPQLLGTDAEGCRVYCPVATPLILAKAIFALLVARLLACTAGAYSSPPTERQGGYPFVRPFYRLCVAVVFSARDGRLSFS